MKPVPLQPVSPIVLSKCNRSISASGVQLSLIVGLSSRLGSIDSPQRTVNLSPQVMDGGILSSMRMVWVTLFELPQRSLTIQVRLSVPVLLQPITPVKSSDI